MKHPPVRHNLPLECYPLVIQALHPTTREIVWSTRVEKPKAGVLKPVLIPPLRRIFGHPVTIRFVYGDGEIKEYEPDEGKPTNAVAG